MTPPLTPESTIGRIAEKAADELGNKDMERLAAALLCVICKRTAGRFLSRDTDEYSIRFHDRSR